MHEFVEHGLSAPEYTDSFAVLRRLAGITASKRVGESMNDERSEIIVYQSEDGLIRLDEVLKLVEAGQGGA